VLYLKKKSSILLENAKDRKVYGCTQCTMCTVHPHTAAPLVVTALPRVITHGWEKTKENAYYMRIYRKQAHKKRHWVLY
jgi:hypothetical protein